MLYGTTLDDLLSKTQNIISFKKGILYLIEGCEVLAKNGLMFFDMKPANVLCLTYENTDGSTTTEFKHIDLDDLYVVTNMNDYGTFAEEFSTRNIDYFFSFILNEKIFDKFQILRQTRAIQKLERLEQRLKEYGTSLDTKGARYFESRQGKIVTLLHQVIKQKLNLNEEAKRIAKGMEDLYDKLMKKR